MTLKERFHKAICILLEKFPEYDICIVGSSSLFLRDIKYKKPHDLDIVILNENINEKPHNIYKLIVSDCALDETNIHIDALENKYGDFKYSNIKICDNIDVKCIEPESYLNMKKLFMNNKKFKKSNRLKHKKTIPIVEKIINNYYEKNK